MAPSPSGSNVITDLAVVGLGAGAFLTLPHGLVGAHGGLVPDQVMPDRNTAIVVSAVDTINVTFHNTGAVAATATFRAWSLIGLETGLTPLLWQDGAGGGSSPAFEPFNTLFVSGGGWPVGSDPNVYFTTIPAALTRALALGPTPAAPVLIVIYPGTYPAPLTLVSNVHLAATPRRDVIVSGAVSWVAGAGINLPQAAVREEVDIAYIAFIGPWSIDTTAKTGDVGVLDAREAAFRAGVTFAARPGQVDFWQVWNAVMLGGLASFNNANVNIFSSSTDALAFTGNCAIDVRACEIFNPVSVSGSSTGAIEGTQINGTVAIGIGCFVDFTGSRFQPGSVLTAALGAQADVRMAEIVSAANIAGAGAVDRSIFRLVFGPTAVGANPVAFATPYLDANYNVVLTQQVGGAANIVPTVSAKTANGFTINDSTGGHTYDATILKE